MEDAKVYTVEDIEKLKQKVAAYRDTLTMLNTRNSGDDKQGTQMEEYERKINHFSGQMGDLNQTVKELNQDLSLIINKMTQHKSSVESETIEVMEGQNSIVTADGEVGEKTGMIRGEVANQQPNQSPSYQQLQSLFGRASRASAIQEPLERVTPIESMDLQEKYSEEQQGFNKKSFPAIGTHPSQIYNGLYKNVHAKSTIHLNKRVKNQVTSVNEISTSPTSTKSPEPEKMQEVEKYLDSLPTITSIEEEKVVIAKEEVSIEEEKALIEKGESQSEITDETQQQQEHKPKETLSIFNFFRKRW
ncbi:hypothetical protein MKY34_10130 [Sporosarcina sp. FSL K6-1522]|uniref:hypothetical protein n=1 Tax=Sporosarcina sp. FSL K6-1522 TaxID=2921554 RepID=UPI00315A4DB5